MVNREYKFNMPAGWPGWLEPWWRQVFGDRSTWSADALDVVAGREAWRVRRGEEWPSAPVLSPDGRALATGERRGDVLVWDVPPRPPWPAVGAVVALAALAAVMFDRGRRPQPVV